MISNWSYDLLLVHCRWYVGDMSRQRSESLLKQEDKEGCFVVRNSSTKGLYTLSLYTKMWVKLCIVRWTHKTYIHYWFQQSISLKMDFSIHYDEIVILKFILNWFHSIWQKNSRCHYKSSKIHIIFCMSKPVYKFFNWRSFTVQTSSSREALSHQAEF